MAKNYGFPLELLDQPPQLRLDFFKNRNVTIMHRNLLLAYNKLHRAVREPAGASIILVIGPSGVGKSTLLRLLEKKIVEESLTQMEFDVGWIPIVCVEAPAPGKGTFRWKSFYRIILMAVDEPGLDHKISYDEGGIRRGRDGKLIVGSRATEDSLRLSMEKALIYRRPYTLAIDEFQHIGKMAGAEVLQAHMDCVKSAVNTTKIPWTGFGTYQLLNFLELSPQLSRRTRVIHIPRYRLECDDEIKEFKRILKHLQNRMPFAETPLLMQKKYWEFCYERSIGNMGTLFEWLTDAYLLALSQEAKTLSLEHLKETAKSSSECEQMALEAMEGEESLTDSKHKSNSLRVLLGLKKNEAQVTKEESPQVSDPHKKVSQSTKSTKPFKRKPKRDPVGGAST